jgi:hypothetical protein
MTDAGSGAGMTRAELLVRVSAAAVATAMPAVAAGAADFASHLGEVFHVHAGRGGRISARLVEIGDVLGALDDEQSFSLILHGRQARGLPQGTYRIWGAGMGSMDLFVVPIGSRRGGQDYQVIFNRIARPATSRS